MGAVYLQASGCPIAGLLQKMVECKPASCVPIFPSQGFYSLSKAAKAEGFVAIPKTMTGVRHLKMVCKDAFRVTGAIQETCSSEILSALLSSGRLYFGASHLQICKMILHDRCRTSYDLASLFHGKRDTWKSQVKRIGARPSAPHSTFHF